MSEPQRLLDDGPDELTANLLRSAGDDEPSPRAFERTALALGVGGMVHLATAGTAAAKVAASGAKIGSALVLKWIGIGVATGLVVAGGAEFARVATRSDAPQERSTPSVAATVAGAGEHAHPVATVPLRPEPPSEPARMPKASAPSRAAPASSAKTPTIAAEIAALDRARAALSRSDPNSALATLDEIDRRGTGALGPEAAVIRVEALLARGDTAKARALAERFVAAHPDSPHAERMKKIVGAR